VIVVDASILAAALGDDGPDGDGARERLRGERLTAPELVDRQKRHFATAPA
jgi:predicted nucleic acid-binding protein